MRAILLAFLLAAAWPAAAQSFIAPGDLDHVLGAALAVAVEAADQLAVVHPAGDDMLESPVELRSAQRRAFRAALTANRSEGYLRLYAIHLGEHREALEEPPAIWTVLMEALGDVPPLVEGLLAFPDEQIHERPFDARASRGAFQALADRLQRVAARIGELPGRYDD